MEPKEIIGTTEGGGSEEIIETAEGGGPEEIIGATEEGEPKEKIGTTEEGGPEKLDLANIEALLVEKFWPELIRVRGPIWNAVMRVLGVLPVVKSYLDLEESVRSLVNCGMENVGRVKSWYGEGMEALSRTCLLQEGCGGVVAPTLEEVMSIFPGLDEGEWELLTKTKAFTYQLVPLYADPLIYLRALRHYVPVTMDIATTDSLCDELDKLGAVPGSSEVFAWLFTAQLQGAVQFNSADDIREGSKYTADSFSNVYYRNFASSNAGELSVLDFLVWALSMAQGGRLIFEGQDAILSGAVDLGPLLRASATFDVKQGSYVIASHRSFGDNIKGHYPTDFVPVIKRVWDGREMKTLL